MNSIEINYQLENQSLVYNNPRAVELGLNVNCNRFILRTFTLETINPLSVFFATTIEEATLLNLRRIQFSGVLYPISITDIVKDLDFLRYSLSLR